MGAIRGGAPDELLDFARQLEERAAVLRDLTQQIGRSLDEVPWESSASQRARQDWRERKEQLLRTVDYLQAVASSARNSAETLSEFL